MFLRSTTWLAAGLLWLAMQQPASACPFCGHGQGGFGDLFGTLAVIAALGVAARAIARRPPTRGSNPADRAPGLPDADH